MYPNIDAEQARLKITNAGNGFASRDLPLYIWAEKDARWIYRKRSTDYMQGPQESI